MIIGIVYLIGFIVLGVFIIRANADDNTTSVSQKTALTIIGATLWPLMMVMLIVNFTYDRFRK